jgi:pSer/pThr/pTyr-binding forkhead associated (FHA) protein
MIAILALVLRILLAVTLYAFLGWALITLWRDLRSQATLIRTRQVPPLSLTFKHQNELITRHFSVPEVTIGRDPSCNCPISDETVSGKHARLLYHHNQWWVEDLQSTNGTFLNHEKVDTPTVLISGDELVCGRVTLTINLNDGH